MKSVEHAQLEARVEALLGSADAPGNGPLREALDELYQAYRDQQRQFERMARISDAYQAAERESSQALSERNARQARQIDKITKLSDRSQKMLQELNNTLTESSSRDTLTGLGNRRHMIERLKQAHQQLESSGKPFCVAMVDIDHFKKVNDTYGHDAGDVVLVQVAALLQASQRGSDACCRWGGEEFVILLPGIELSVAADVVERTREAIANREMQAGSTVLRVTGSFGLAQCRPDESYSDTVKRADEALYRAKRGGRNRVEVGS